MKVRWAQGSVRLRITPTELQALQASEWVREELTLPGGGRWAVEVTPHTGETGLTSDGGAAVRLRLSLADVLRLARPEAEGVYFQREGEPPLRYYIEKDFPCVHPRAIEAEEPPTESFPEPEGFRERKGVV